MRADEVAKKLAAIALCSLIIMTIMTFSAIAQGRDEAILPLGLETSMYSAVVLASEGGIEEVIITQGQTASEISAAIQTALGSENITTLVKGSKTNMNSTLYINIPEGKKLIWKAHLIGSTANSLISLSGEGSFEVAEGAEISALSGRAIECDIYDSPLITVSGGELKAVESSAIYAGKHRDESMAVTVSGGIVSNVGSEDNPTIYLTGYSYGSIKSEVIVKDEGKVKSSGTNSIAIFNSDGDVLIEGMAEVTSDGAGAHAIKGRNIIVEAGMVSADYIALFAQKDVLVQDGEIQANGYAIYTQGKVTIKGGSLLASGADACTICARGNIQVIDGTVIASGSNGVAIMSMLKDSIVVEGGWVSGSKTGVLSAGGDVRVSGGIVSGGSKGIDALLGGYVTVEGGQIEATDIGGNAIFARKDIYIKAGRVSANQADGTAITALTNYVTIENGIVEAIGPGGRSIHSNESRGMHVMGGKVEAHTTAIMLSSSSYATLRVSGGEIYADEKAIVFSGANSAIAVDGGEISGDIGIELMASGAFNLAVTDGSIIGTSNAIRLDGFGNLSATVTGGIVVGYGSKYVAGNNKAAIYMRSGSPVVTYPGTVIAWNKAAGNILYGIHTEADIAALPESSAKWSRMDGKSGLSYGSDGFIELEGISVVEIAANATGLDELQVDKDVNATIIYSLTGSSFVSDLNAMEFVPEELPDWLNIIDTAIIENKSIRIVLSGRPSRVSDAISLTLPGKISANRLISGDAAISIPVSGGITIAAVAKGEGSFAPTSPINASYTENMTLASLNAELAAGYAWETPSTLLSAGDGQSFPAKFTDLSGNYEAASGNITINVAKGVYTGTTKLSDSVPAGQRTIEKILILPALPDGASYGSLRVSGDLLGEAASISDRRLSYSTTSQANGVSATISISVCDAANYIDYDLIVTIIAKTVNIEEAEASDTSGASQSPQNSAPELVIVIPDTADKPDSPIQAEIKFAGISDSSGNISVDISGKAVAEAYDMALAEAEKKGREETGIMMLLRVDIDSEDDAHVRVNLPKAVQETIIAKKILNTIVVMEHPEIRIDLNLAAVQEISKEAQSDFSISVSRTDNSKLTNEAKNAIGSRPVYELEINYGNGKQVQSFGAGSVSVSIPYSLAINEKAENVQAVYVDAEGKLHWLIDSVYDSVEELVSFRTQHFSSYGIGYKEDSPAFADIEGHWAKADIEFVLSRGLFKGTSESGFSPNISMTRGMFVTVMGRLAKADVSGYAKSSFSDVQRDAYYMAYIEWAKEKGIVSGIGNGKFAAEQAISREQIAVIMCNYAKSFGYSLAEVYVENNFIDSNKISSYAKEAVKQMQMVGVISGKNGNLYDPQAMASRAEVSAILHRFLELAN